MLSGLGGVLEGIEQPDIDQQAHPFGVGEVPGALDDLVGLRLVAPESVLRDVHEGGGVEEVLCGVVAVLLLQSRTRGD